VRFLDDHETRKGGRKEGRKEGMKERRKQGREDTCCKSIIQSTVEPAYKEIGLSDAPPITLHVLRYQLIPHC
jgi:hypothetical protein